MPKTNSIRPSISTEHRLVTDRRGHRVIASTRVARQKPVKRPTTRPVVPLADFATHVPVSCCSCPPARILLRTHRRKLLLGPEAQALPHFYDHGARLYDEPPHFCDVILSKLCFNCSHWFYAMPTNRHLDHSFPAVLDIFGKGLNLPAPLDIQ